MMLDAVHWPHSVRDLLDAMGMRTARPEVTATVESIRSIMLDAVKNSGGTAQESRKMRLNYRIASCSDVQGLWYLRSDLMHLMSAMHGELESRRQLDDISQLFEGLLPKGLQPRRPFRYDGRPSRKHD